MIYLEVLCEGSSDVPVLREVLTRGLKLKENEQFRIHPHQGKGKLPANPLKLPTHWRNALLDQLPIKLRNYGKQAGGDYETAVLVVVDADDDDCVALKRSLTDMLGKLPEKPKRVLFRIAVEETESWFIADAAAVKKAYPRVRVAALTNFGPDAVCGAWERLAEALGLDPKKEEDKTGWATAIVPHLDLQSPKSPSLRCLVDGVPRLLDLL
jgi:hypothetical protein